MLFNQENIMCITELRNTVGNLVRRIQDGQQVDNVEDMQTMLTAFDKHVDRKLIAATAGLDVAYVGGLRHTFATMLKLHCQLNERQIDEVTSFLRQYDDVIKTASFVN
ncbi:Hypothetical protein LUCI_1996 [Lucifera butyrica]|uniref:Uncharacterized protein n=1 Tax=Lucifera butyrica TaxID=1351585 RepID=A0A498R761_9FIRM|nr:hypothetical protein [Lucifera butyrica]VBB06760.1 Hypothetical protein LUCI_1996 [Lucifera butyrica]